MSKARATGKVLLVEQKQFGTGDRIFRFKLAHVQTGVASIEEIRFTDDYFEAGHDVPRAGDIVDLEIEISVYTSRAGSSITSSAVRPFDESFVLSLVA